MLIIKKKKELYFISSIKTVIQNIKAKDYAKIVLLKIKDKIKNIESITDILELISKNERNKYEKKLLVSI